ncbi:MAG: anti-sigma factor [Verrucomicrobiota bacterium]
MITDESREEAVLFVLGLLGEAERESFLDEVKKSAELRALVSQYRYTLSSLAVSEETGDPPESLRAAIIERASGESMTRPKRPSLAVASGPRTAVLGWLVAACFALLSVALFYQKKQLETERDSLVQQADLNQLEMAALASQSEAATDASARIAWNQLGETGIIHCAEMPPLPEGKSYQLWVFEQGSDAPVSCGVIEPSPDHRFVFRPDRTIQKATAFAVSIEELGGSPQPEGEVILVGGVFE